MKPIKINIFKVILMFALIVLLGLIVLDSSFRSLFDDKIDSQQTQNDKKLETTEITSSRQLLDQYKCFSCHDIAEEKTGPSFITISRRYRDNIKAKGKLVDKVEMSQMFVREFEQSRGQPSKMHLFNDKAIPKEDVKKMIDWILSLRIS